MLVQEWIGRLTAFSLTKWARYLFQVLTCFSHVVKRPKMKTSIMISHSFFIIFSISREIGILNSYVLDRNILYSYTPNFLSLFLLLKTLFIVISCS